MNLSEVKLKKADLRVTAHRLGLLEYFMNKDHAITNQEIEQGIKDIDRITLYRTLKSFEERGLIHRIVDHNGVSKYALCQNECDEANHHHQHIHFHCHECDNTFCVSSDHIPEIKLPKGFMTHSTEIMICGTCEKCHPQ